MWAVSLVPDRSFTPLLCECRHFNRTLMNALYKIAIKEAIDGIKNARNSNDELIRSHTEEFLSRLTGFELE